MSGLRVAIETIPIYVWAAIALLGIVLWFAILLVAAPEMENPDCESCGHPADVTLDDGSRWCLPCHLAALQAEHAEAADAGARPRSSATWDRRDRILRAAGEWGGARYRPDTTA